jgi:hypothetical protein
MSVYSAGSPACERAARFGTKAPVPKVGVVPWAIAASAIACGSSDPAPPPEAPACAFDRSLTCTFFAAASGTWSTDPPASVSLGSACADGGSHGEIDAFVETRGQYWLDRVGFVATGSAVLTPGGTLQATDDAGGATYGCGHGGGRVLTQLFCGQDVGTGTLTLRFAFAGRWADGSRWSKECTAALIVVP